MPEDVLAMAERHVRDYEARVAEQAARVDALEAAGHAEQADIARRLLATLENTLAIARDHVRIEREARGIAP